MSSACVRTSRSGSLCAMLVSALRHLRMLEVLERQHHFDAHVGRGSASILPRAGKRARIADAAERLDRRPLHVGIAESGDERLDGARIFEPAERVGGGDADPPVGIAQQFDRGGHDADIVEDARDCHRAGARVGIGIVEQLDDRLDERIAEFAQRFERAVAHEAGQAARRSGCSA